MKILMLNYEFPPIGGGAGQAQQNILRQFSNSPDLRVDVLTCGTSPGIITEQFSDNIKIIKVGIKKDNLHYWKKSEVISWLLRAGRIHKKLVKENDYDLAHAFFGFPTGYLPYKTAGQLPYIISLRGSDVPGYNIRLGVDYYLLAGLFKRIWTKAKAVIANSDGLAKLAKRFTPELVIPVIVNGIDTRRYQPIENHALGEQINLLTVCRLISRKRIDILINAVKICLEKGQNVRLNIAGHGNLRDELEKLAKDLNIYENVRFLGRVENDEMPEVYQANDIFVMSSAHEGMSNAMLEAMACGLPIVTTHCEGVDELIAQNGIIAKDDSPERFAEAIEQMINDKTMYQQSRLAAREQAEKFSWANTAAMYIDAYKKAICN